MKLGLSRPTAITALLLIIISAGGFLVLEWRAGAVLAPQDDFSCDNGHTKYSGASVVSD